MILGGVYIFTNRAAQGIGEFEQALALTRNVAYAHAALGFGKYLHGCAAETEGHILEALRLSPRDVVAYQWTCFVGVAKLQLGADVEAVSWLRRSIEANRNFPFAHFGLAAALGLLGALDEARTAARTGLALDPGLPFVASSQLNKATIQLTLLGCSACVKACASLACRRGDVGDGSKTVLTGPNIDFPICSHQRTSPARARPRPVSCQ